MSRWRRTRCVMPYTECAYEVLKWYMKKKKNFEKSKTCKNNQRSSENKIFAKNVNYVKKKYKKATRAIIQNIGQQMSGPDSSNCWSIRDESQGWGSPIRSRHFLSQNVWHLHKNIHSLVENELCCPREVNISNVNFTSKILLIVMYAKVKPIAIKFKLDVSCHLPNVFTKFQIIISKHAENSLENSDERTDSWTGGHTRAKARPFSSNRRINSRTQWNENKDRKNRTSLMLHGSIH